jgi:hypothetical protein
VTARNRPDARRCPNCGAPAEPRVRPFCSKRCRDLDLARWLDGGYAIPVVEEDGAEDDELSRSDRDR